MPATVFFGVFQVWLRVFIGHNPVGMEVPMRQILPMTLIMTFGTIMIAGPWIFIALLLPLQERVRYNHFIGGVPHEMNINYVKGRELVIVGRVVPGVLMSIVPVAIITQHEIWLMQQIWDVWQVVLVVVMMFFGVLLLTSGMLIKSDEAFPLKLALVLSGFSVTSFVLVPLGILGLVGTYLYTGIVFLRVYCTRHR